MNKTDFFQVLTLWFVVVIVLQTGSGDVGGIVGSGIAVIAVGLLYLLPLYLLAELSVELSR